MTYFCACATNVCKWSILGALLDLHVLKVMLNQLHGFNKRKTVVLVYPLRRTPDFAMREFPIILHIF